MSPEDRAKWERTGWVVPCPSDIGRKRFDTEVCRNCLCAGNSDATPYCMGYAYDMAKKVAVKYTKYGNFREYRRYCRNRREEYEEEIERSFGGLVLVEEEEI